MEAIKRIMRISIQMQRSILCVHHGKKACLACFKYPTPSVKAGPETSMNEASIRRIRSSKANENKYTKAAEHNMCT